MPASWIPREPTIPADQRTRGVLRLRYEDVSQDGHVVLAALPQALVDIWRHLSERKPRPFGEGGVLPILSRVIAEGGGAPIAVGTSTQVDGVYQLAHTAASDGSVDRILLVMWATLHAPIGRTYGPPPEGAGTSIVAGRVFAEHVFTRPFAPAADRKVRTLEIGGRSFVPEDRHEWRDPVATIALPEGATALDVDAIADEGSTVFGIDHTDSNQHVNSLVYPRLFVEAALRRVFAHGPPMARLARAMEIAYRKPCFAGERARIAAQAFALGEHKGASARLTVDGDDAGARPRSVARVIFDR